MASARLRGAGEHDDALASRVSFSTARKRSGLSVCGTRTMYWSTVSAVSPLWAISTSAGSRSSLPTLFWMERSMVAENRSVWRSAGVAATIFFMDGQKPMSSMRSASSSTSTPTSFRCTALLLHEVDEAPGRGDEHVDAAASAA